MHEPIVNIAIQAARAAGRLIARGLKRLDTVKVTEKSPNDFVTEIDQQVEKEIINVIHKAYPSHGIIAEESGEHNSDHPYVWIIDPIDGTRNFIHGFPHFAVSIAIRYKDKIEHGVIYDPVRQEFFTATRGKGAHLNDRRIRVSPCNELQNALLGTGFAYRYHDKSHSGPEHIFKSILPSCGDIRRAGAATLDLAYVACGRLDGYWEQGLKIWDIAAGILLIKEAGGIVTDLEGGESYLQTGDIVAANPKMLRLLLKNMRANHNA
jgi:myo-inositol-1(or 4)-monophosphatase